MTIPEISFSLSPRTIAGLKILVIVIVGMLLNATFKRGIKAFARRNIFSSQFHHITSKLIKWTIIVICALLILQQAGISMYTVWTSLSAIFVLVAVGFIAFWSILSNISAALLLVLFAPFRIGDEIEILEPATIDPAKPGIRGKVIDISFLYTTLAERSDARVLVRLPNSMFFQKALRCRRGEDTTSLRDNLFDHETS